MRTRRSFCALLRNCMQHHWSHTRISPSVLEDTVIGKVQGWMPPNQLKSARNSRRLHTGAAVAGTKVIKIRRPDTRSRCRRCSRSSGCPLRRGAPSGRPSCRCPTPSCTHRRRQHRSEALGQRPPCVRKAAAADLARPAEVSNCAAVPGTAARFASTYELVRSASAQQFMRTAGHSEACRLHA